MLAEMARLPFHDNVTPPVEPQVLKAHYYRRGLMPRGVLVWRDGRDVMSSFYFHSLFKFVDKPFNHAFVDHMRAKYRFRDYHDIRSNLPEFLERELKRPSYPSFTWPEFASHWADETRFVHVLYEDFSRDPSSSLHRLMLRIAPEHASEHRAREVAERFSIKNAKGGAGQFVRRGKVGGWQDDYSPEAVEIFNHYGGGALRRLGYQ